ncbi:MAG: glucose 1-dehydrogenase [Gammaproteobacteria bacterium]|nr:glucose 1-dehydrogenase [Gammaproteobacteria bacterium]
MPEAGRVRNKVALVTGGASGIGRATCIRLAQEGATVVVADLNQEQGKKTVSMMAAGGSFIELDVTSETRWQELIAQVITEFGQLNVLVNCAGIGISGVFEETRLQDWQRIMDVNLTGLFLGCKHAVLAMQQAEPINGSIINISSIAGVVGGGDIAAYSASKGGVTTLTKSVALSCAERGMNIRCNSIHPTYVDSEMLDPIVEFYPDRDAMRAAMSENIPMGRMATPEDIANSVLFLASEESSIMTGATMMVDGGTTAGVTSKHSSD